MPSQNFKQVDDVCMTLGKRADALGIDSLSEYERNVMLVWWAKGIIDNGGFEYFYQGATNVNEVSDAYEALGFAEAAEACRRSTALFPPHILDEGPSAVIDWLKNLDEDYTNNESGVMAETIWKLSDGDRFDRTLSEYIRIHEIGIG